MIVIAIIGLLMAGIFVAQGSARARAQVARSEGQIKRLATAITNSKAYFSVCPPDGFDTLQFPGEGNFKVYFWHVGSNGDLERVDMSGKWSGTQCLVYFLGCPQPIVVRDPEFADPNDIKKGCRVTRTVGPFIEDFKDADFDKAWLADQKQSVSEFLRDLAKNPTKYSGAQMPEIVDAFHGADLHSNAIHYDVREAGGGVAGEQGSAFLHPGYGPAAGQHDPDPRCDTPGTLVRGNPSFDLWSHGQIGHGWLTASDRADVQAGKVKLETDDLTNWGGGY